MSDLADLRVSITADNKVEKGAKEAEKRLGQLPKRLGDSSRRAMNDNERLVGRSTKSMLSSFAKIEQASAKAFGGRSLTAGLAGRMGAVGEAASAMGEGLAGAATSGGLLSSAVGGVAVAVGATVAVLGAAAVAAYKLATDWAKGAAQIGRTADIIGMGTKALQEFAAASERAGVDKNTAIGAAGSLSQTLNDARYGRNTTALEAMRRTGVEMKLNKDGTVNTDAMLPAIADALRRQNSSGRRTLGRALGIPDAALPAFTQGGKALSADMRDTDKTASVLSDREMATATRIARKGVMLGQIGERAWSKGRGALAEHGEGAIDVALQSARAMSNVIDGDFKPAAKMIHDAAEKFVAASNQAFRTVGTGIGDLAHRIETLGERSKQWMVSPKGARGVMQVMPGTARRMASMLGERFDEQRYRSDPEYSRHLGGAYLDWLGKRYGGDQVLTTAAYNAGEGRVDQWIKRFGDPRKGQITDEQFAQRIPFKETRDYVNRVVLDVHLHNAPPGTKAVARSRGAVSTAMQH